MTDKILQEITTGAIVAVIGAVAWAAAYSFILYYNSTGNQQQSSSPTPAPQEFF